MFRLAATAAALALVAAVADAAEFRPSDTGQIEFEMPSGNVGCIYTPAGGTGTYRPADGGAELICDRAAPSYVRVILGADGMPRIIANPGEQPCCSGETFGYGDVWQAGPFRCQSSETGLSCQRGGNGFRISRKSVHAY